MPFQAPGPAVVAPQSRAAPWGSIRIERPAAPPADFGRHSRAHATCTIACTARSGSSGLLAAFRQRGGRGAWGLERGVAWRLPGVRFVSAPAASPAASGDGRLEIVATKSARRVKSDSIEWEDDDYDYDGGFQDGIEPQFAMTELEEEEAAQQRKAAAALKEEKEWEECNEEPSLVAPAPRHPQQTRPPSPIVQGEFKRFEGGDFDDAMDESSYDNAPYGDPPASPAPGAEGGYGAWADRYSTVMAGAGKEVNVPNYRYPLYLVDQSIDEMLEFLCELGLPDLDAARRLLRRFRLILAFDPVETRLVPVVEFLSRDVGLSRPRIGRVLQAYPWILLFNPRREMAPVNELLRALSLSRRQIAELWCLKPQLPRLYEQGRLQELVAFLREEVGLAPPAIGRLIATFRSVLTLSVPRRLAPKVAFLLSVVGTREKLARALWRFPGLLGLSERKLRPAVELLRSFALDDRALADAVARAPQIITYRPEKVEALVAYLAELGIAREEIGRMVRTLPNVLGLSVDDKVRPTVEYLEAAGFSREQVARLVRSFSSLLGLKLDNIEAKMALLTGELGLSHEFIVQNPTLVGYSSDRLRQRRAFLEHLAAAGHERRFGRGALDGRGRQGNPSPLALPVIQMAATTDARFASLLDVTAEQWFLFRDRWERERGEEGPAGGDGEEEPLLRRRPRAGKREEGAGKEALVADGVEGDGRVAQLLEMDRIRRRRMPRAQPAYGEEEEDPSELVGGAVTSLDELRRAVSEASSGGGRGEEEDGSSRPAAQPDSPYFRAREHFIRQQRSRAAQNLLAAVFGGSAAKAKEAVERAPAVAEASLPEQLRPALALLSSLGLAPAELADLVQRWPAALLYPLETQITAISFLHSALGFALPDIGRMAVRNPRLLGADLARMQRSVELLRGSLGASDPELRTLVAGNPAVLLQGPETIAAHHRAAFGELRLPVEALLRHPWIYTASTTRLAALVAFAAERGVALDPDEFLTGDLQVCGVEGCNRAEAPTAGRRRGRPPRGQAARVPSTVPLALFRQGEAAIARALGVPLGELKGHMGRLRHERELARARARAERAEGAGLAEAAADGYAEDDEPRGRSLYLDPQHGPPGAYWY